MRILLVEDNPGDAFITKRTLRGHEVHWSSDLNQALAAVATFQPEAVLLDLGLPDSQGVDTFRRLKSLVAADRIVVLTGNANDHIHAGLIEMGAAAVLTKTMEGRARVMEVLAAL